MWENTKTNIFVQAIAEKQLNHESVLLIVEILGEVFVMEILMYIHPSPPPPPISATSHIGNKDRFHVGKAKFVNTQHL